MVYNCPLLGRVRDLAWVRFFYGGDGRASRAGNFSCGTVAKTKMTEAILFLLAVAFFGGLIGVFLIAVLETIFDE